MANSKEKASHSSKHSPDEDVGAYARLTSLTFELLSLNLIIIGGGYYLGTLMDTRIPWILIFSIFLSVAATIFYLLKKLNN